MKVRRNTRRIVKDLCNTFPICRRFINQEGKLRFVASIDNGNPGETGWERYLVEFDPHEIETLVLQVPAKLLIETLGSDEADKFAKTLRQVLNLH